MRRSPFLFLVLFLILFSCKNEFKDAANVKSDPTKTLQLREKAMHYFDADRFDSAYVLFKESQKLYESEKDSANITYCLYQLAMLQQTTGNYNESEVTLTELLTYKNSHYNAAAYNQLGIIAKEQKNYDDAINYYNLTLKNAKSELERLSPLNNIAAIYVEKNEPLQAITLLKSILKSDILKDSTHQLKKARYTDNLGYAYFRNNQPDEALLHLNEGLKIRNTLGETYDAIESYLHLAAFYQNTNLQKSNAYALKAYQNATDHKSIDERLEALSFLMANNSTQGRNPYVSRFLRLNDSITKVRNTAKNQFAKIKYDSQKEKDENQQLKLEKAGDLLQLERAKTQSLISVILLSVLAISSILVVNFFRKRNRKEKQKAVYDTEKRISKQLHDELANDVFQTISYVQVQELQNPQKKETLLNNLEVIYKKARDISRGITEIDTGFQYEPNLKQMLSEYANDTVKVIVKDNHDINWDKVNPESKVAVYRVLQELMVNMKKHSQASIVVIGFEDTAGTIQIKYSDNGIGMTDSLKFKNGLKNAENRILSIKGTLTFEKESETGFRLQFSIPK